MDVRRPSTPHTHFAHYARAGFLSLLVAVALHVGLGHVTAEELDRVTLKDGSVILGHVINMVDGTLKIKTDFGGEHATTIVWSEVSKITTSQSLPWVMNTGTTVQGTAQQAQPGELAVKAELSGMVVPTPLDTVVAINPPKKKTVTYTGNANLGASATSGNTDLNSANLLGELTARAESLRLSLRGRWIYADKNGEVITRNALGTAKLDFFLTERFYLFTSAFGEQDTFQDVNLRTALSGGHGYQIIEKNDFSGKHFHDMEVYAETGVAFFNEDFKQAQDKSTFAGRWSIKWDWQVFPALAVFHYDEGFPGFEDLDDIYITTEQGFRFTLFKNFIASTQVNWRFKNIPSPGFKKTDTQYLFTLGYKF